MLRLVQLSHPDHGRRVAVVEEPNLKVVRGPSSVVELATAAIAAGRQIADVVASHGFAESLPYNEVYGGNSAWKLLSPIDHPQDAARCLVTGTGLTHKASADNRQSMHGAAKADEPLTDSMRMYRIGLEGGRPKSGEIGAQPEWFYKGCGTVLRTQGEPLDVPNHGFDGGDEAEIAGVYLVGPDGRPYRIGLAQSNEFSDHVLEAQNYLYLAASKLRACSLGPELLVGGDFAELNGIVSIERAGKVIWRADVRSGEVNMSHTLANLEHHHFKNDVHRRAGDVHIHFFGADVFSFRDRLRLEDGDVMVVSFDGFGRPLRNPIRIDRSTKRFVSVAAL